MNEIKYSKTKKDKKKKKKQNLESYCYKNVKNVFFSRG